MHGYTVKNAVELLDVTSRNNSQMMKKYNSHVEILFLYTHVLACIFSQCGIALVMDLRKLSEGSHLDQKNSIGMQFTYINRDGPQRML
jgi:hypothetical protein